MPRDTITLTVNGRNQTGGMFRSLKAGLSGVGSSIIVANQAFGLLTRTLQATARAVEGLVKPFAEFEEQMNIVRTLINTTDEAFQGLQEGILEIARTTPKSIDELTVAMYDLVSAGVAQENALWAVNKAQRAAVAGNTDVQTAAGGAMATVNAFGLELEELTRVYDLQFNTVRRGVITFKQLASGIGRVLPSAKSLGATLEEVHAAIAIITLNGFASAETMTVLTRSFDSLSRPSTVENFKELGIEIHDQEGTFRGMIPIVQDLADKLKTATDAQKTELFGVLALEENALKGFKILIDKVGDYEAAIEEQKATGEFERAHAIMEGNIKNRWDIITNKVKIALIEWVTDHATTLNAIVNMVDEAVNSLGLVQETVVNTFKGAFNVIKIIFNAISIAASGILLAIAGVINMLAELASQIPLLPEGMKNAIKSMAEFTSFAMDELAENIKTDWQDIEGAVSGVGEAITEGMTLSEEWRIAIEGIAAGFKKTGTEVDQVNIKLKKTTKETKTASKAQSDLNDEVKITKDQLGFAQAIAASISDPIQQAASDMIMFGKSTLQLKDILRSVLLTLTQMVIQALILRAIFAALGIPIGGSFFNPVPPPTLHKGGIIPTAHKGLFAGDERLVLAQTGEAILNRGATRALGGRPAIDMINATGELPARGAGAGTIILSINTMIGTDAWVQDNLIPVIEKASDGGYSRLEVTEGIDDVVY